MASQVQIYEPTQVQIPQINRTRDYSASVINGAHIIAIENIIDTVLTPTSLTLSSLAGSPPPPPPPIITTVKPFEPTEVEFSSPSEAVLPLVAVTEEEKCCCCYKVSDIYLGPLALVVTISALATFILTRPGVWLGEALHYFGLCGLANFAPLVIASIGGCFPGLCYLATHACFETLAELDHPSHPILNHIRDQHSWMHTVYDAVVELTNFS